MLIHPLRAFAKTMRLGPEHLVDDFLERCQYTRQITGILYVESGLSGFWYCHFFSSGSKSRFVEPAAFSFSKAHSNKMAPRLPSDRCSFSANPISSERRDGRILIVTDSFHSPI